MVANAHLSVGGSSSSTVWSPKIYNARNDASRARVLWLHVCLENVSLDLKDLDSLFQADTADDSERKWAPPWLGPTAGGAKMVCYRFKIQNRRRHQSNFNGFQGKTNLVHPAKLVQGGYLFVIGLDTFRTVHDLRHDSSFGANAGAFKCWNSQAM